MINKLQPTIGLEIHVELATKSKMFCGCPADHFGKEPNTQTCPVCLGLPGALPVPQRKAVDWTIMIGLALNCKVASESKFDRKHYFYPDLPKGYQISQYDEPLCSGGFLETAEGKVRITRVHLEEDTGKLLHSNVAGKKVTLVDFNRSGVPLVEIVTEPDIHSSTQAKEFSQKLQQILRYLEVSDCDMEKGSLRLEANVSLGKQLGYKVEVKNLNSFRFVERAIDYELVRQRRLLESGRVPKQETRGWNETENATKPQRYKETEADYRYFPEPDIPPMLFTESYVERIKAKLPELPEQIASRWIREFGLRSDYALILVADKKTMRYAEQALRLAKTYELPANTVASEIVNKRATLKKTTPSELIESIRSKNRGKVSEKLKLEAWVKEAIASLPQAVSDYQGGKLNAIAVLIGKVMQLSKGKADAEMVRELLEIRLKK